MNEVDFEDIFYSKHGVGDIGVERDTDIPSALVDKSVATHREKQFVQLVVSGKSKVESYLKIFDPDGEIKRTSAGSLANRLMKRKRVVQYYVSILEQKNDLVEESLPKLIAELNEDRELARALGQPGAAIQAVKTKANMLGLENKPDNVTMTVNVLSDDAKKQLMNRISKQVSRNDAVEIEDAEYKDITPDE